jgi:hypothetical protein
MSYDIYDRAEEAERAAQHNSEGWDRALDLATKYLDERDEARRERDAALAKLSEPDVYLRKALAERDDERAESARLREELARQESLAAAAVVIVGSLKAERDLACAHEAQVIRQGDAVILELRRQLDEWLQSHIQNQHRLTGLLKEVAMAWREVNYWKGLASLFALTSSTV